MRTIGVDTKEKPVQAEKPKRGKAKAKPAEEAAVEVAADEVAEEVEGE